MRWWKAAGLAGLVGVAATGVVVARSARVRAAYEPDEIRARLQERLADTDADTGADTDADPDGAQRPESSRGS